MFGWKSYILRNSQPLFCGPDKHTHQQHDSENMMHILDLGERRYKTAWSALDYICHRRLACYRTWLNVHTLDNGCIV